MGYLGQQASFTGTQNNKRISVTANSGQIDFLPTGGYAINAIDVYRNGVKLVGQRDFLALDGVTVTLTQAANSGDTLEFVIYENFVVADVLNGDGDQAVRGNFAISGDSRVGIDTSTGVILKSPNGTSYRLYVENDGTLKTQIA
jgi:hypothetical protein